VIRIHSGPGFGLLIGAWGRLRQLERAITAKAKALQQVKEGPMRTICTRGPIPATSLESHPARTWSRRWPAEAGPLGSHAQPSPSRCAQRTSTAGPTPRAWPAMPRGPAPSCSRRQAWATAACWWAPRAEYPGGVTGLRRFPGPGCEPSRGSHPAPHRLSSSSW